MRILMIAPEPVIEPRGTPISVYQRLCGLSKLGHQIDLLTYHVGRDFDMPGVQICRIPGAPWIREVKIGPSFAKLFLDLQLIVYAGWLLLTRRYDVIHSHEEAAYFCTVLAALFDKRHLYDMHSSLPQQLRKTAFGIRPLVALFETLERWSLRRADVVITVGADLQERVREIAPGVSLALIHNLPVQVSPDGLSTLTPQIVRRQLGVEDCRLIVYTGSFEHYQGLGHLIHAAKLVMDRESSVRFLLVGGKPDQVAHWRQVAYNLGMERDLLFTGLVPASDVIAYVEAADILVSSRTEGLSIPLKIYSYMQAAKPIVATNILAHMMILDVDTAVLVEPTAPALATGLMQVLSDPELGRRLGENASHRVTEQYGFELYLTKLGQTYRELTVSSYDAGRLSPLR